MARIHVFGASGSGVTALGQELSKFLSIPVFDADNYYWKKTDPPFTTKNTIEDRYKLLLGDLDQKKDWIISGSMDSWCEPFLPMFQLAIFLYVPAPVRLSRLKQRESERHGSRILTGGDMENGHKKFIDWAAQYDEGHMTGRSLKRHEEWIQTLPCPLLRIEGEFSLDVLVQKTLKRISDLELSK